MFWDAKTLRDLILKYRQGGVSTLILAEFFEDTVRHPGTTSMVVAHKLESARTLFKIVRRFYDNLPEAEKRRLCANPARPQYHNRRELQFDRIDSWFGVATAGEAGAGRSLTINNLHLSEVAFWPGDAEATATGLIEAVPLGGRIRLESTAKGIGGYFHGEYGLAKGGASRLKPHFFPWWTHEEHRLPLDPGETVEFDESSETGRQERELASKHGLAPEQLKWRRAKILDLKGDFWQEHPEDDVSCFLLSGRPVFDQAALMRLLAGCAEPTGAEDSRQLLIWQPPDPKGHYVIGADTAEGLVHGDWSVGLVIDRATGSDVACLRGHWPDHVFASKLDALGRRYNTATLGVEDNNHGHSVINTLVNVLRYPKLYARQDYDHLTGQSERRWGWLTSAKTKPILVDYLAQLISTPGFRVANSLLVSEALTFEHKADGSMGSQGGCFDDSVIAWGIAHQMRLLTRSELPKVEVGKRSLY